MGALSLVTLRREPPPVLQHLRCNTTSPRSGRGGTSPPQRPIQPDFILLYRRIARCKAGISLHPGSRHCATLKRMKPRCASARLLKTLPGASAACCRPAPSAPPRRGPPPSSRLAPQIKPPRGASRGSDADALQSVTRPRRRALGEPPSQLLHIACASCRWTSTLGDQISAATALKAAKTGRDLEVDEIPRSSPVARRCSRSAPRPTASSRRRRSGSRG